MNEKPLPCPLCGKKPDVYTQGLPAFSCRTSGCEMYSRWFSEKAWKSFSRSTEKMKNLVDVSRLIASYFREEETHIQAEVIERFQDALAKLEV